MYTWNFLGKSFVVVSCFSALFLAYTNGAARLCRELLRGGGSLGTINKHGVSIFNAQVPTKKLLYTLLGRMSRLCLLFASLQRTSHLKKCMDDLWLV